MKRGNYVLMFVVRELNRDLSFMFWFGGLAGIIWFSESETSIFPRRSAQMTDGANYRTGADKSLSCEKLLAMTTYASIMIWKICDIRKSAVCGPIRGDLMTGITGQTLMLFGKMKERRVLRGSSLRCLLLA